MIHILVAESMPAQNKGEMAIFQSLYDACVEEFNGQVRFEMLSFDAQYDRQSFGDIVKLIDTGKSWPYIKDHAHGLSVPRSIFLLLQHVIFCIGYMIFRSNILKVFSSEIWQSYLKCDVLIYGHDSSFGVGGDPENPLLYPLYIPVVAKILGKKVMFFAGSIPPSPARFKWLFRIMCKIAFLASDAITLREPISKKRVTGKALKKTQVTADIAYLLRPDSEEIGTKILSQLNISEEKKLVGFTISHVRARIAYPHLNFEESQKKHFDYLSRIIEIVCRQENAHAVLIPHSVGAPGTTDDREANKYISDQLSAIGVSDLQLDMPPKTIKSVIGKLDLLVGERLHSVIAASSMSIPTIAISYRKDTRLPMVSNVVGDDSVIYIEDLETAGLERKMSYYLRNSKSIVEQQDLRLKNILAESSSNVKILSKLVDCND